VSRATTRHALSAIGAVVCSLLCTEALAHAPLARRAVFSVDGSAAAVSLPGFGIAIRSDATSDFAYLCDALLEIPPSDVPREMAFVEGALLVGSGAGLRSVTADGCPQSELDGTLASAPVVALAAHPRAPNVGYAVTQSTTNTTLARSPDGGRTWEMRATWPEVGPVTALVLGDTDTNAVYLSQVTPGSRSAVRVSTDGGVSFSSSASDTPRELLAVQSQSVPSASLRFWAVARSATSVGNRGFELHRADAPEGPWTTALQVNFFGGFAIEPGGAIWMGDEGGGVYQAVDGAASFTNVAPSTGVACLTYAQGTVWGCTSGTPKQPALVQWNGVARAFDGVVALGDITRLVECDAAVEVERKCSTAWAEWQRDVLMIAPPTPAPADAGAAPAPEADSSCSVAARTGSRKSSDGVTLLLIAALLRGARKRRKSGG
jgi:hypothetical protein